MKSLTSKILLFIIGALTILFFTNDFGLIDIEKTAIITALAIDKEEDEYSITAQIAVPEATDINSENKKSTITGTGKTVGSAIKNIGNISGWFPKLAFCNLVILGNDLANSNVIKELDYFAKTLRIQDSTIVILAEKKAKDLLQKVTPLDSISSFAIQKVLLKDPGFDRDIAAIDIRDFTIGYYGRSASSYMPLVKIIQTENKKQQESTENSGSLNQDKEQQVLFDATTTALFTNGIKSGELNRDQTLTFNLLFSETSGTTLEINEVNNKNYLLTMLNVSPEISLNVDKENLILNVDLKIYCTIADQTSTYSENTYLNSPLPSAVKEKAESQITRLIQELVNIEKESKCDIFGLLNNIYKYNYSYYHMYKDNYIEKFTTNINVDFSGQK